jgi:twitching motility protein PilT
VHEPKRCLINQREVGSHATSFDVALRATLREDPDVILIGEIRDAETMKVAIMAADTGHLVMSTLHTPDAAQTINRIISFFPLQEHDEVRYLLASNLTAVVCLRLIPHKSGQGRVPAVEVMMNTGTISEYIMDQDKTSMIQKAIQEGVNQYGMQTFDQALMKLYKDDMITYDEAIKNSTNPAEFDLRARGIQSASDSSWDTFEERTG